MNELETVDRRSKRMARVLRDRSDAILRAWEAEARDLGPMRDLDRPERLGSMPRWVAVLADITDRLAEGVEPRIPDTLIEEHAAQRVRAGFDVAQVAEELTILRRVIANELEGGADDARWLAQAVDLVLVRCVDRCAALRAAQPGTAEERERMLALVSHDLRTPLTAIDLSSAVLLEMPQVTADSFLEKQLRMIRRNTARMTGLIGDLLDVSSIDAGRLALSRERCALAPLLGECLKSLTPLAEEKGVSLRREILLDEGAAARCDRIEEVLGKLIENAISLTERGGEVSVRAELRDGEARVSVADSGPAIAPEDFEHVFDLSWKGRPGQRAAGMRLFIARAIVEAHGGRMWVEQNPPRGSRFAFTLPLLEGDTGAS